MQAAKDHFGCSTLTGMLLENQGAGGSLGSHWERTIFNNEIMNAIASNTDAYYSKLTFALLLDTNWYLNIDLSKADETPNGRNKGCAFVTGACTDTDEFCPGATEQCDYHHLGYGPCTSDSFTDVSPSCKYKGVFGNA